MSQPMQLRIAHTTGFEYDGKANTSFNEARLTPLTLPGQIVAHSRVEVHPTPWAYTYRDYWGSQVTAFEVLDPHQSLTVTALSTVHTDRSAAGAPVMSWEELRADSVSDGHTEFLALPDRVAPPTDLVERARKIASASATPGAAAREICALVNREVKYVSGSTTVDAFAAHSWAERSGVCQDMAHIAIGALRSVGIPARYVSGYLHPRAEPVVGETVTGESHAWVEWWDDGWRGFDPTNDTEPGNRHVVVATGRDYNDVKPLSGIFSGSGTSRMFVDVQVTRLH
jgi:transglutaminase-like putative cysteine protease